MLDGRWVTSWVPTGVRSTAFTYSAQEFNAFDDGQKQGGNRSLLSLNGDVAGRPFVVCKPRATQLQIPIVP